MARRKKLWICCAILILVGVALLITAGLYLHGEPREDLAYCREYVAGEKVKGDVDVEYFEAHGEAFEIGANRYGYAVFKDPRAAMDCICKEYKDGLALMRQEWGCPPFFRFQYHGYSIGGSGVDSGKKGADQVDFILSFLGIYQNSFPYGE